MEGKCVFTNGVVTASILADEEADKYRNLVPGVYQTSDMIQLVAESDEEKRIFELTANGYNCIRVNNDLEKEREKHGAIQKDPA